MASPTLIDSSINQRSLMSSVSVRYTEQDVLSFAAHGKNVYLINGEIIEVAPAKLTHGSIGAWVQTIIGNYVFNNDLGMVYTAETGFKMPNGDIFGLDISFIAHPRVPTEEEDAAASGFLQITPDFAIEIYSKSNTALEFQQKFDALFSSGLRLGWVIYPGSRTVHVYATPNQINVYRVGDELDGGAVLPGFRLKVSDIFKVLSGRKTP